MVKKIVSDLDLKGKTVLVRTDFNVPLKGSEITSDNRIVQALPAIQYIIEQDGKTVLFLHLGRAKRESDKTKSTLHPVAEDLSKKLDKEVVFAPETRSKKPEAATKDLKGDDVLLVENTRYEDLNGKKESKNDPELGKYQAPLGDVFVNNAFGTAHRGHASNVGVSTHLETVAGLLVDKETKFIGGVVNNPRKPAAVTSSRAKVSDKINVIKDLANTADKVIIDGGVVYTFLKAQGKEIGISLLEEGKIDFARNLLEKHGDKIVLPVDAKVAKEFSNDTRITVVPPDSVPTDQEGMDIRPNTVKLSADELRGAHTAIWNEPMGVLEFNDLVQGTTGVCKVITSLKDAITIIGGGGSAATTISLGSRNDLIRILTGGGTSLEYLEGKKLPDIKAISNKQQGDGLK